MEKLDCIKLAVELGYQYHSIDNIKNSAYDVYVRSTDDSTIYINDSYIELEGYPTALYYIDAITNKERTVVKNFINCKITVPGSSVKDINVHWKKIITLPNTGIKKWYGGAYALAFVYSNKGNFICKGYHLEIEQYLLNLKSKGYKYFVNYTLWSGKQHRSIWLFHLDGMYILQPEPMRQGYKRLSKWRPWRVTNFKDIDLKFKRLPKRWIPEFENL